MPPTTITHVTNPLKLSTGDYLRLKRDHVIDTDEFEVRFTAGTRMEVTEVWLIEIDHEGDAVRVRLSPVDDYDRHNTDVSLVCWADADLLLESEPLMITLAR